VIKIDKILETDASQNRDAVLSMFEVFFTAIESDDQFSHLKRTIIQADNAACFHDKSFVFGIAFLNKMQNRNIRIDRKIHTETQDGKSLLDTHFACGTKQVVKYLKTSSAAENKRVGLPVELAKALAWNGGIQNSVVLLIEVDREKHLPAFNNVIQGCSDKALEYFS
jgi:SPX domain protein involved in polyphosphate accumulation